MSEAIKVGLYAADRGYRSALAEALDDIGYKVITGQPEDLTDCELVVCAPGFRETNVFSRLIGFTGIKILVNASTVNNHPGADRVLRMLKDDIVANVIQLSNV